MGTVTYPHAGVERRLDELFVAIRPQMDLNETLAQKFVVAWTPGMLFLDSDENIHHRAYGFHPPEEFEHLLDVGHGMVRLGRKAYREAAQSFSRVTDDEEKTTFQPEAMYWLGVALYRSGEKEALGKSWNRLLDQFPESVWAKKASIIRPRATAEARR